MKNDKFILMNMDDDRSKKIAEVLGNTTCKKIINYLAEEKEASEQDLADALNIPLNTLEYNLKKLIESGLVEKTKNFFWSKKGKKIPMYKLAKKHIVISPKDSKPNMSALKTILPIISVFVVLAIILALTLPANTQNPDLNGSIKKFNSMDELNKFLEENKAENNYWGFEKGMVAEMATVDSSGGSSDYSTTNVQVEGVDEADILKNDGEYIYTLSDGKVLILKAYPAENMKILSEIKIKNSIPIGLFLNEDKLVVIYSTTGEEETRCGGANDRCYMPQTQETGINIYEIGNRENPELEKEIAVTGNYHSARMIDNYVYLINNQYVQGEILPVVYENGNKKEIPAEDIYYTNIKDNSFQYTILAGVNVNNGDVSEEVILTGGTSTVYVSENNIYLISYDYHFNGENSESETIINKIEINDDEIEFVAEGEVPGHILNQFSMDEFEGNLRIATTVGDVWGGNSENNIYVLDEELEIIGELEGLAPGEKIYSVRFMGERGYIVTFKKVDPLFVIDLSDAENPKVLGKLKIPGYSDYLHIYDENHIIGIGKDAVDASDELTEIRNLDFAWYQGVKMAIFDVSDVENPIELHKVVIGDRGTYSEVLNDHKAFLFDKERELLVLPITLAEIHGEKTEDNQYGEFTFQGAYVYKINLKDGFELRDRITHYDEGEVEDKSGYYFSGNADVRRALYIGDVLYTLSNRMIKANDLDDLEELNHIEISDGNYLGGMEEPIGI